MGVKFSNKMRFVSDDGQEAIVVNEGTSIAEIGGMTPAEAKAKADYDRGYQEATAECQAKAQATLQNLELKINELSREIPEALSAHLSEMEEQARLEICDISFYIAETIVKHEVEKKDILKEVIRSALSPLLNPHGVKLRLNPEFAAKVNEGSDDYQLPVGVQVVADAHLGSGEALIESDQGFIDATIRGRLETLKEKFLQSIEEE